MIPLSRVHNIGMPQDMSERTSLARHDGINHWIKIQSARRLIYEKNYAVDSSAVERLLKEHSLVPTSVRVANSCSTVLYSIYKLECLFRCTSLKRLQPIRDACSRSHA